MKPYGLMPALAATACGGAGTEATQSTGAAAPTGRVVNVYNWPDYIAPGLLEQFTTETDIKVNYGNLDPEMMAKLAANDPGNRYAVGDMWGMTGIGYDAHKVAALLPDAPTDSWRLVFDPAVARELSRCSIAFVDVPSEIPVHSADVAGQGSTLGDTGGPGRGRSGTAGDPSVRSLRQQRADLRGPGLGQHLRGGASVVI